VSWKLRLSGIAITIYNIKNNQNLDTMLCIPICPKIYIYSVRDATTPRISAVHLLPPPLMYSITTWCSLLSNSIQHPQRCRPDISSHLLLFPLFLHAARPCSMNITESLFVRTTRDWGHEVGVAFKKEPELTLAGKALAIAGPNPFQSAVTPSAAINFRAQSRKPEYVP